MIKTKKPNRCTECKRIICSKSKSNLCGGCYRKCQKAKDYRKEYQQRPEVKDRRKLRYIKKIGKINEELSN